MTKKTLLLACLSTLVSLSGCVMHKSSQSQNNAVYTSAQEVACPQGVCETDPFINYTNTRANFRQYGELSPRDQIVSQSGAGNNVSASIPPSIENEVINYQEQVEQASSANAPEAVEEIVVQEGKNEPEAVAKQEEKVALKDKDNGKEKDKAPQNSETATEDQVAQSEPEAAEEQVTEENTDEEDPVKDWYAEEGQNLKALLTKWSDESGWRLVWNSNRNYVLNAGAMFRGRFADVSSALIRAFARARPAPVATFYKGNRVLVVETMEDENAYD